MTIGRRAAALAIRGYRRWLSGRGPLRRVACTYAACESCSAFGLRAVHEAPTLGEALRRIRARLGSCHGASLYRLGDRGLGWGADHDLEPAALAAALDARGEAPAAIAQALTARGVVARWRGEPGAAHGVARELAARGLAAARVPLRPGDLALARHRRLARRAAVAAALVAAATVAAVIVAGILGGLGAPVAALAARSAWRHRRAAGRLARQRAAASFLRPAVPAAPVAVLNDAAARNAASFRSPSPAPAVPRT